MSLSDAIGRGLQLTRLLAGLPPDVVAEFLDLAGHRGFPCGAALFVEGEAGDGVYVVLSGKVKVTRPGPDGKDVPFTIGSALECVVSDNGIVRGSAPAGER